MKKILCIITTGFAVGGVNSSDDELLPHALVRRRI